MKNILETIAKIGVAIAALRMIGWVLLIALVVWILTLIF